MPEKAKRRCPLWLMLLVGALAIGLQLTQSLVPAAAGFALVIALFVLTEPDTLRMIGNWRFWIAGLLIAGLSGFMLGKHVDADILGLPVSFDGLSIGAIIVMRAAILVTLLMALSKRLSPDLLVRSFARIGMPEAGGAFALGVKLLPRMVATWKNELKRGRRRGLTERLARLIAGASELADEISRDIGTWISDRSEAVLFTITGMPGSGKSSLIAELVSSMREGGIRPNGFYQPVLVDQGERIGYDLVLLPDEERLALARPDESGERPWKFDDSAFTRAGRRLEQECQTRVWIVDEIGRLERRGYGHWPVLARCIPRNGGVWVLSVRMGMVDAVLSRLGYHGRLNIALPCTAEERSAFIDAVVRAARESKAGQPENDR